MGKLIQWLRVWANCNGLLYLGLFVPTGQCYLYKLWEGCDSLGNDSKTASVRLLVFCSWGILSASTLPIELSPAILFIIHKYQLILTVGILGTGYGTLKHVHIVYHFHCLIWLFVGRKFKGLLFINTHYDIVSHNYLAMPQSIRHLLSLWSVPAGPTLPSHNLDSFPWPLGAPDNHFFFSIYPFGSCFWFLSFDFLLCFLYFF